MLQSIHNQFVSGAKAVFATLLFVLFTCLVYGSEGSDTTMASAEHESAVATAHETVAGDAGAEHGEKKFDAGAMIMEHIGDSHGWHLWGKGHNAVSAVSYTHLRAHETVLDLVCRLLLEKKKPTKQHNSL